MHPVSGPAMQAIIDQLIADVNELKKKVRIEMESSISKNWFRLSHEKPSAVIREVIDQVVEHLRVHLIRVGARQIGSYLIESGNEFYKMVKWEVETVNLADVEIELVCVYFNTFSATARGMPNIQEMLCTRQCKCKPNANAVVQDTAFLSIRQFARYSWWNNREVHICQPFEGIVKRALQTDTLGACGRRRGTK